MISVFKTTVSTKKKVKAVKPAPDKIVKINKWNFDLDDCDNNLRIESKKSISELVINELKKSGFKCQELQ